MNPRKLLVLAALLGASSFPALTALADSGFYIGGGLGQVGLEDTVQSVGQVDDTDTAWKAFAGYRLDLIPIVKAAVEAGYRDLGRPNIASGANQLDYKADGFDYAVLAGLALGPIELFGRYGGMQYKLERTVNGVRSDFDGTAAVYGIGLGLWISRFSLRAEYEKIDIRELDRLYMATVSAILQF